MASPFTNVAFDGVENLACKDKLSGYIFLCNGKTKADCYRYRVFGLPAARLNVVEKIRPCMMLFLFDFELKLLYGVYRATSNGGLGIEPTAFQGKFLAQVRFEILKDCLPLPESAFKHVIKDNYNGGSKFKQELHNEQVTNLMSLFRPIGPIPKIPVPFSNVMPEAEVSASCDQYLAKQILNHSGPSNFYCSQPAHHPFVLYASNAHRGQATPAVQSVQQQPIDSRWNVYLLPDDHQPSVPEDLVCLQEKTCGRRAVVPNNGESRSTAELRSSMPQTAAYWFKDPNQAPSYAPVQLSSSSLAPLHFFNNAKQIYHEPDRVPLLGSCSVAAGNQPIPYLVAAGSHTSVPRSSENDVPVIANHAYASPFNASVPAHAQVLSHDSGPSYGNAYTLSSSGAAAYWTTETSQNLYQVNSAANQMWSEYGGGDAYQAASVTKEMLKAYDQVSYHIPASSYGAVYCPSNEALASWMVTTGAPN